jgi:predicted helicase
MRLTAHTRRRLAQLSQVARDDLSVACALPWTIAWRTGDCEVLHYLLRTAPADVAVALQTATTLAASTSDDFSDCCHPYLLEQLLAVSSAERRQRGVYFTPAEIVRYIVRSAGESLVRDLDWADGLAAESARILDPSAGSGVFLAEVIRTIHERSTQSWLAAGCSPGDLAARWNDFTRDRLLPRLVGWEIMPAGVVAAHCVVAAALYEMGYEFGDSPPLGILQRDALAPPDSGEKFSVILGNPPYASLSTARHGWAESLIQSPDGGYMMVDGEPLGEKKHWLHDDYVKFLRLAQWHVEQSGAGVIGMVTNHGYLTNASFRGMRASLLKAFSRISVVDLHGNAKMHERSPDGSTDENVFGIGSGVAIGVFTRPLKPHGPTVVQHGDLWGTRSHKLAQLSSLSPGEAFTPSGPAYRFTPRALRACAKYENAWRLCDAMPVNTSAPVTARDHFVVAFSLEELVQSVEEFRDLSIPDKTIGDRYFTRTRSTKYARGDSRGWKLAAARRQLADDAAWRERLTICQYRPFDYRYVLWHEALIDWPRREVMRQLLDYDNLALIARRQSPAGLPASFFWATRMLTLDGILRSDNRGSESLFPLWSYDDAGQPHANFAPEFVASFERVVGQRLKTTGPDAVAPGAFTPLTLARYIYGLFWSPDYRGRYQQELADDFPRILPPDNADQFFALSRAGLELLRIHTRIPSIDSKLPDSENESIAAGYPRWRDGQVWINPSTAIAELSKEAWELHVGVHQVAKKWLKDRRGRLLTRIDVATYRGIATALLTMIQSQSNLVPNSATRLPAQVF